MESTSNPTPPKALQDERDYFKEKYRLKLETERELLAELAAARSERDTLARENSGGLDVLRIVQSELSAARSESARLREALCGVVNLLGPPSPFYIKKLGMPITNGDQDMIDTAFMKADAALAPSLVLYQGADLPASRQDRMPCHREQEQHDSQ